jgi:hypothetical protein
MGRSTGRREDSSHRNTHKTREITMLQFLNAKRAPAPIIVAMAAKNGDAIQAPAIAPIAPLTPAGQPANERGFAWFDSSRELRQGLMVKEQQLSDDEWSSFQALLQRKFPASSQLH